MDGWHHPIREHTIYEAHLGIDWAVRTGLQGVNWFGAGQVSQNGKGTLRLRKPEDIVAEHLAQLATYESYDVMTRVGQAYLLRNDTERLPTEEIIDLQGPDTPGALAYLLFFDRVLATSPDRVREEEEHKRRVEEGLPFIIQQLIEEHPYDDQALLMARQACYRFPTESTIGAMCELERIRYEKRVRH